MLDRHDRLRVDNRSVCNKFERLFKLQCFVLKELIFIELTITGSQTNRFIDMYTFATETRRTVEIKDMS